MGRREARSLRKVMGFRWEEFQGLDRPGRQGAGRGERVAAR